MKLADLTSTCSGNNHHAHGSNQTKVRACNERLVLRFLVLFVDLLQIPSKRDLSELCIVRSKAILLVETWNFDRGQWLNDRECTNPLHLPPPWSMNPEFYPEAIAAGSHTNVHTLKLAKMHWASVPISKSHSVTPANEQPCLYSTALVGWKRSFDQNTVPKSPLKRGEQRWFNVLPAQRAKPDQFQQYIISHRCQTCAIKTLAQAYAAIFQTRR